MKMLMENWKRFINEGVRPLAMDSATEHLVNLIVTSVGIDKEQAKKLLDQVKEQHNTPLSQAGFYVGTVINHHYGHDKRVAFQSAFKDWFPEYNREEMQKRQDAFDKSIGGEPITQ